VQGVRGHCNPYIASAAAAFALQVLMLTPSTVYVAGTSKQVHIYSFQLEEMCSLDVGAESVFGIDVDAESEMLAVCGAKACIDLLSAQGATLGVVRPAASVLMS
jgi:hypothetical protein